MDNHDTRSVSQRPSKGSGVSMGILVPPPLPRGKCWQSGLGLSTDPSIVAVLREQSFCRKMAAKGAPIAGLTPPLQLDPLSVPSYHSVYSFLPTMYYDVP